MTGSLTRLFEGLATGDDHDQVGDAYIAAQQLRHGCGARDLTQARDRLFAFYTACADTDIPNPGLSRVS